MGVTRYGSSPVQCWSSLPSPLNFRKRPFDRISLHRFIEARLREGKQTLQMPATRAAVVLLLALGLAAAIQAAEIGAVATASVQPDENLGTITPLSLHG